MTPDHILTGSSNRWLTAEVKWGSLGRSALRWFTLGILAYLLAASIVSSAIGPILVFWLGLFFVIALKDEFLGFLSAMVVAFYSNYIVYLFSLGSVYLMLPYVMVLSFFASRAADVFLKKKVLRSPVNKTIVLLVVFTFISVALNSNALAVSLKGIIKHVTFVLLFLLVANSNLSEMALKKLIIAVAVIAFLQIPASVFQYYVVYADFPTGARFDRSAGLLGFSSGDINAVFMTFSLSIIFGLIVSFGLRFKYLLGASLLPISFILSSAKAGFIFFVVTPLFLTTLVPFIKARQRLYTLSLSLVAVVITLGVLWVSGKAHFGFITNPAMMWEYNIRRSDSGLGRLQALGFVHSSIGKNLLKSIVGYGPGAITPTRFLGRNNNEFYQSNDLLSHYNDYAYITLELGYGGLVIRLFLLYQLFIISKKIYDKSDDKFWKAMCLGLAGIIFTSAYSIFYTRSWSHPALAVSLWFFAGSIVRMAYLKGLIPYRDVNGRNNRTQHVRS